MSDDLSFCEVDGRLVFLDVRKDVYFQLSRKLECAFRSIIDDRGFDISDAKSLVERGVLVEIASPAPKASTVQIDAPTRSAMEGLPKERRLPSSMVPVVFWAVLSTRRQLRKGRLGGLIDALIASRRKTAVRPAPGAPKASVLEATHDFRRARLYVPVETSCLLDSLSLVMFLARRGLYANLVFAVTTDPFAAHCWAQVDDLVLNDSVGNAQSYTPIRIV